MRYHSRWDYCSGGNLQIKKKSGYGGISPLPAVLPEREPGIMNKYLAGIFRTSVTGSSGYERAACTPGTSSRGGGDRDSAEEVQV
jgi:hypothetical protein